MNGGAQFWFHQFIDGNGNPYSGVKVYHTAAGTDTLKNVWTNEAQTPPVAANPVVGDSRGMVSFYADGDYKLTIKDANDVTLYTWDNVKITPNTGTMWEGNAGTAYPSASTANRWQQFLKHDASNNMLAMGVNTGSAFKDITHGIYAHMFSSFTDAVTAADGKTLIIMGSISLPSGAITIPATVLGVHFIAPGVLVKGSATSLTILAPIVGNPMHQIFSGFAAGEVTFGDLINPILSCWWGWTAPATSSVNRLALQCSITALLRSGGSSYNDGELIITGGNYDIDDQINFPVGLSYAKITVAGFARIRYTGTQDDTKSMFRLTASSSGGFDGLTFENIYLYANNLAGFCWVIEGSSPTAYANNSHIFKNCNGERARVANVLIGDNAEPAVNDVDASNILFDQCDFYNALHQVKINAADAYGIRFNGVNFGCNITAATQQHVRLYQAGGVYINECEFGPLTYTTGDVYCVYAREGGFSIRDSYSEECRVLKTEAFSRVQQEVIIENFYTNDSRTTANGVALNLAYSIYAAAGNIKSSHNHFSNTGLNRQIYVGDEAVIEKTDIGSLGYIEMAHPEKCIIDGYRPGAFETYIKNWDMERWDTAGTDLTTNGTPIEWSVTLCTGGTKSVIRSTDNNVYGNYTAYIHVTVDGTSGITGLVGNILNKQAKKFTVIVTGTKSAGLNAAGMEISINSGVGQNGGTNQIVKADNTFILWAEADLSGQAVGRTDIKVGIEAGIGYIGEMWIDTVVIIPGYITPGLQSGLINGIPDRYLPAKYYHTNAPATGTWDAGDIIWSNSPSASNPPGWVCVTSGSPGTWKAMANLAA